MKTCTFICDLIHKFYTGYLSCIYRLIYQYDFPHKKDKLAFEIFFEGPKLYILYSKPQMGMLNIELTLNSLNINECIYSYILV